jgi:hypothetical protein
MRVGVSEQEIAEKIKRLRLAARWQLGDHRRKARRLEGLAEASSASG